MERIYFNPMASESDLRDFILEGKAELSYPGDCLRMKNALSPAENQKANYVLWCPVTFPSDIMITWEFRPIAEPGLSMLFFAAKGRNGEDLFAPELAKRTGEYPQYHHGDINAFHVSYFRRKEKDERAFHTCNLRKSYGFYLTAQGADPIPNAEDADGFYQIQVVKEKNTVLFRINELEIFRYIDDGISCGPLLQDGKIGFRQLAPLIAEYKNLNVYRLD